MSSSDEEPSRHRQFGGSESDSDSEDDVFKRKVFTKNGKGAKNGSSSSRRSKVPAGAAKKKLKSSATTETISILDDDDDDGLGGLVVNGLDDAPDIKQLAKARAEQLLAGCAKKASGDPTPDSKKDKSKNGHSSSGSGGGKATSASLDLVADEQKKELATYQALLDQLMGGGGKLKNYDLTKQMTQNLSPAGTAPAFVPKKILTAAEREQQAASQNKQVMSSLLGPERLPAPPSPEPPADNERAKVKIKTRMNGSSSFGLFKLDPMGRFGDFKVKFAEHYGIRPADVLRFVFDGDDIGDDSTPSDIELEDGFVIEVKVTEQAYKKVAAGGPPPGAAAGAAAGATGAKSTGGRAPATHVPGQSSSTDIPSSSSFTPDSVKVNVTICADVSQSQTDSTVELTVKTSFSLQKLHAGLDRANLFANGKKTTYFLDANALSWDSELSLADLGLKENSSLIIKLAPIVIVFQFSGSDEIEIKVLPTKAVSFVLNSVRNHMASMHARPNVTFLFNNRQIIDESQTLEAIGLKNQSIVMVR